MRYDPHDIEELDDDEWIEKYGLSGSVLGWPAFIIGCVVIVVFAYWLING